MQVPNIETSNTNIRTESAPSFIYLAAGARHLIGITQDGAAYSRGRSNEVGQLGRDTHNSSCTCWGLIPIEVKAVKAYVSNGCSTGSGHSAILDRQGQLWMAGCDRWQQLGLGSAKGGTSGYTWKGGKLWQDHFMPSGHILDLMKEKDPLVSIRDVALGGDHTLILSSNRRDVYAFGKGGDGQLGLIGKPYVSAPVKSKLLSADGVNAVCAIKKCSLTLNVNGEVKHRVGKCGGKNFEEEIKRCIHRAYREGLVKENEN